MKYQAQEIVEQAKSHQHVLLLMRHAQADSSAGQTDRDRRLTEKGVRQATKVGKGLHAAKLVPARVACSGATRARQTLDQMLTIFGDGPQVDWRENLYSGGIQAVFDEIAASKDELQCLMVLAHEPTISAVSQCLADRNSNSRALALLGLGMSPAHLALLVSDLPWAQCKPASMAVLALLGPDDWA